MNKVTVEFFHDVICSFCFPMSYRMRQAEFPFPTSMKALTACKAAYFTAGDAGYWDVFDALQNALFVQNRNIEEEDIINECIRQSGIDFGKWEQHYNSGNTKEAVEKDLLLAEQYGIDVVPCLIIDGKYRISGAQPLGQIIQAIQDAAEAGEIPLFAGASCRLDGGKINCD